MRDVLLQGAIDSASGDAMAFIKIITVFGDLAHSNRFTEIYIPLIKALRIHNLEDVIRQVLK